MTYVIQSKRSQWFWSDPLTRFVPNLEGATHYPEPPMVMARVEKVVPIKEIEGN
jgi:hypothetical protein